MTTAAATTMTTTTAATRTTIDLFGGAMTCEIPSSSNSNSPLKWRDVSDVRQIPSHQECYQSEEGHVLVIEILEYQSDISNKDAAKYFFDDLAEANNGSTTTTTAEFQTTTIPFNTQIIENNNDNNAVVVVCGGIGYQKVGKSGYKMVGIIGQDIQQREQEIHSIKVELCVFRLANVSTDLLITMSKPTTTTDNNPNNNEATTTEEEAAAGGGGGLSSYFQHVVSTLTIRDWGLFG